MCPKKESSFIKGIWIEDWTVSSLDWYNKFVTAINNAEENSTDTSVAVTLVEVAIMYIQFKTNAMREVII